MHNHDTNETFMPITGRWRCAWNEGPEYEVVDVGSLNGTYVNRTLVDGTATLRDGDEVQIGKFRMIFHTGGHGRL